MTTFVPLPSKHFKGKFLFKKNPTKSSIFMCGFNRVKTLVKGQELTFQKARILNLWLAGFCSILRGQVLFYLSTICSILNLPLGCAPAKIALHRWPPNSSSFPLSRCWQYLYSYLFTMVGLYSSWLQAKHCASHFLTLNRHFLTSKSYFHGEKHNSWLGVVVREMSGTVFCSKCTLISLTWNLVNYL